MTPHATAEPQTNGDMSNHSAPLTNGETPRSRVLSVRSAALSIPSVFTHINTTGMPPINGYRESPSPGS